MSIWFSSCFIESSATPTTIRSEVPPKLKSSAVNCPIIVGITAITARNIAPTYAILVITFVRYSAVGLPGLIPGIKPPLFFILFAISTGLKVIAV